jgi:hypothetical protein
MPTTAPLPFIHEGLYRAEPYGPCKGVPRLTVSVLLLAMRLYAALILWVIAVINYNSADTKVPSLSQSSFIFHLSFPFVLFFVA